MGYCKKTAWIAFTTIFSALLYFITQYREGSYPYIYTSENAKYSYKLTYIDGEGHFVIEYEDQFDQRCKCKYSAIILDDVYPKSISQNCKYAVGKNGNYINELAWKEREGYFILNKESNQLDYGLTRENLIKIINERKVNIDLDVDNTSRISDRKQLYTMCSNKS